LGTKVLACDVVDPQRYGMIGVKGGDFDGPNNDPLD
jgi:hypothetical protein